MKKSAKKQRTETEGDEMENGANTTSGKDGMDENTSKEEWFPIKLVIPPNRSRFIFFKKKSAQLDWIKRLEVAMGSADVYKYY